MALQLYSVLPSPPMSKGFAQDVFSVFFEQWFGEHLSRKEKIRIHSVSNADKYEFGLSWTLRIMGRLGVFSLQSATSRAEGGVGGSQAIKQCWRGRAKPWLLVGRATTEHWGKVSLSCFSQQDIFSPMEETCPISSLESHCLLYTCSMSHHSEITSVTTFTCTPLNRTEQIQASLFRADWSHNSKPDSPKQRGACKNSPLHIPRTPFQNGQHTAVLWHVCTAGANQGLTPPAATGNAKWGADGWAGSRSSNQS